MVEREESIRLMKRASGRRVTTSLSISEVLHTSIVHTPPAMVFFFLFLFAPLFAAFLLIVYLALCKPGCAVSAADTSSV